MADTVSERAKERRPEMSGHKGIPKGVVLGKDGKPCRTCASFRDWAAMTRKNTGSTAPTTSSAAAAAGAATATPPIDKPPEDCPADVETLGRGTWTFLHTLSATYPSHATPNQQSDMRAFLMLFAKLYPCWNCAQDFQAWMQKGGNEPRVRGRGEFGTWMCEAHNEVNRKLGKKEFDCRRWEERWRTGWGDGRCD
ncbi:hypothetical protein FGG08_004893 [Glutinoglossum americanum]|uniref:Sulfhydryl oxidase n=1 Tax=Glutinoglossum americanum TaxID=1670608 RepID=A0A9P8HZA1_9PEZI|nr:hypothetical protein FGG08_004893 [Glutinoglossum americanum]